MGPKKVLAIITVGWNCLLCT